MRTRTLLLSTVHSKVRYTYVGPTCFRTVAEKVSVVIFRYYTADTAVYLYSLKGQRRLLGLSAAHNSYRVRTKNQTEQNSILVKKNTHLQYLVRSVYLLTEFSSGEKVFERGQY